MTDEEARQFIPATDPPAELRAEEDWRDKRRRELCAAVAVAIVAQVIGSWAAAAVIWLFADGIAIWAKMAIAVTVGGFAAAAATAWWGARPQPRL